MHYVISSSYGNDSMAMIQWAHENNLKMFAPVTCVYTDTGWSHESWGARVDACEVIAKSYGFNVARTTSMGMRELVRMKQGWPGNGVQFCTAHLKGVPFLDWIDEIDKERTALVLIGKRREESTARANTPEWVEISEYHGDRSLWHPLYLHVEADRNALLARAGVEVLPHRSRECEPCVNANKGDIRRMTPQDIAKVNDLEVEIGKPMFRPKRFNGIGIYSVVMWAKHGKHHEETIPDEESGCGSPFGCGL